MLQKYKEFLFRRFKAEFNNIERAKSVWIDTKALMNWNYILMAQVVCNGDST